MNWQFREYRKRTLAITLGMFLLLVTPVLGRLATHQEIAEIVEAEAGYDLFSGTVLVAKNGVIVYTGAFGEANKGYHLPNTIETKFNISSVQKTFVATLIMQLGQDGLIDLDDSLTKYYTECPWKTAGQIRIRHLLNHTAGLSGYRDNDEYRMNSETYSCIDDVLPLVWRYEPTSAPGERFRYSNAGILLLKGIIERVTGGSLTQVLTERIWRPLGMNNTTMYVGGDLLSHRASAYRLAADGESYRRVIGEPSAYAGGGIYTTVLDLLKFDQALYKDDLLNENSKRIMFSTTDVSPDYAYGWEIRTVNATTVIYHGGNSGGFESTFRRYPDPGYTLIVLSNYDYSAWDMATRIERLLVELPYSVATVSDLNYKRGMHFQSQELYDRAIESFESTPGSDAPHMPSIYQAAKTRILGQFDQETAISLLDQYIFLAVASTQPSKAAAWWRKGVAYEQLGRVEMAVTCFEQCLELDAAFTQAYDALESLKVTK